MKKKPLIITVVSVAVVALVVTLIIALSQCGAEKYEYENAEKYKIGDFNQTIEVSAIDVEWLDGSVEIVMGVGSGFSCYEYSEIALADDATMRTWFDGSVLKIRPAASGTKLDKIPEKTLTVCVPAGYFFNDIDILTDSADVTVDQVGARFASISTSSGNIVFNHIGEAKDVKLSAGSGEITYNHMMSKVSALSVSTESGNISITDVTPAASVSATSGSGSVTLTLPDDSGFVLTAVTNGGLVSYGGFVGVDNNGKLVVGDGSSEVTLKSDSGSIVLKKSK